MSNVKNHILCILKYNEINRFPINILDIKLPEKEWTCLSYLEADKYIKKYGLEEIIKVKLGLSIKLSSANYLVLYDGTLSESEKQEVIAHELGHIEQGHTSYGMILGKSKDGKVESLQEKEAEEFKKLLLAYPCILAKSNLKDYADISYACGITEKLAKEVSADIGSLSVRKVTQLDKEICKQFRKYINKHNNKLCIKLFACISLVLLSCTTIYFFNRLLNADKTIIYTIPIPNMTLVNKNAPLEDKIEPSEDEIDSSETPKPSETNTITETEPIEDTKEPEKIYIEVPVYISQPENKLTETPLQKPVQKQKEPEKPQESETTPDGPKRPTDTIVYLTATGSKFHRFDCSELYTYNDGIRTIKDNIREVLTDEAINNKKEACKKCFSELY